MDLKFEQPKRKLLTVIYSRTLFLFASLLIQFGLLLFFLIQLSEYLQLYYSFSILISVGMLIYILNGEDNPSYKMAWIIPVAVFPVFGTLFYLFVHIQPNRKLIERRLSEIYEDTAPYMKQDVLILEEIGKQDMHTRRFVEYMNHVGPFPVYADSDAKYYPLGDDWYPDFLKRLREAKQFIFIEFFIVSFGEMWDTVFEILAEKAKEGVEVRLMYDGTCTFFRLPVDWPSYLQKFGIESRVYSPIRPALSTYQNNRDHRKIVVIDGKYAYTGGVNLADEYINRIERFGHWKDTAVEITGSAVDSFTVLFLQLWNISNRNTEDISGYIKKSAVKSDGYLMGFTDSPFDTEQVGKNVYLDIINTAVDYVHIMTPYLILDDEMIFALTYAVKRGVDVTIIMPHITDKPYAYILARNYYEVLIRRGIRIYEYTPGFVHAKVFVSDDTKAVVGSINLDYRSLYLNFECAAYLYQLAAIKDVEEDFKKTLEASVEITLDDCKKYSPWKKFLGKILRFIGPLM